MSCSKDLSVLYSRLERGGLLKSPLTRVTVTTCPIATCVCRCVSCFVFLEGDTARPSQSCPERRLHACQIEGELSLEIFTHEVRYALFLLGRGCVRERESPNDVTAQMQKKKKKHEKHTAPSLSLFSHPRTTKRRPTSRKPCRGGMAE